MHNKNYCHDVSAVLVTYNPDTETLSRSISAVSEQVSDIFIIDNDSASFSFDGLIKLREKSTARIHFLPQLENLGVGAGHNIGIQQAQRIGSVFVLLLDQDSQVGVGMVMRLRKSYGELEQRGIRVAALGPRYRDSFDGELSKFVKVSIFGFSLLDCEPNHVFVEADFLVSSGSLLPLIVIETVGLMDESLFIDHVDTEWCFRAKAEGFHLYGVCGAVMTHTLGEKRKSLWFLRQRSIPFHNPFRYYYMFRNSISLYSRAYMPWSWKLADSVKNIKIFVFFGLIESNRLTNLKMMVKGLIDGWRGINGRRF